MLDINFIRENTELVEKSAKEKGYKNVDIKALLELDDERKEALKVVEDLRKERNETAAKMKGGKPSDDLIKKGKEIKEKLATEEKVLEEVETKLKDGLKSKMYLLVLKKTLLKLKNGVNQRNLALITSISLLRKIG